MPTKKTATTTTANTTTAIPQFDAASMNDQFIAAVKQNNETVLDNVSSWAASMAAAMPVAPTYPTMPEMPFMADLPEFDPRAAALAGLDFAAEMLKIQRDFTLKFFDALAPLNKPAAAAV